MNDALQRYANLASGLTRTTAAATERLVAGFVRQGEVAAEQAERLFEDVVTRSIQGSGALAQLVKTEVEQAMARAGYVRADEVQDLRREVDDLRARLAARDGDEGGTQS